MQRGGQCIESSNGAIAAAQSVACKKFFPGAREIFIRAH
jgi:hypothetical protein